MASKGDTRLLDRLVAQAQGKAGPISAADFDFPKQAQTQPQPLRLPTATTSGNTAARTPKTVNLAELPLPRSTTRRQPIFSPVQPGTLQQMNQAVKQYRPVEPVLSSNRQTEDILADIAAAKSQMQPLLYSLNRRGGYTAFSPQASPAAQADYRQKQKRLQALEKQLDQYQKELKAARNRDNQGLVDSGEYRWGSLKDLTLNEFQRANLESLLSQAHYDKMMGKDTDAIIAKLEQKLANEKFKYLPKGTIQEIIAGASGLFGQQYAQFSDPDTAAFITSGGLAGAGLGSLAGGVGAAPGAIAGATAGWVTGSAKANFEIEAGRSYMELLEHGVSEDTARKIALAVGGGNAALELLQLDELTKGLRILRNNPATQGAAYRFADALMERALATGNETLQEVAQEGVTITGTQLGVKKETGEYAYTAQEVQDRLADTAKGAALTFGLMNVPGVIRPRRQDAVSSNIQEPAAAIEQKRSNSFALDNAAKSSWRERRYTVDDKTYLQSKDGKQLYEVPRKDEIRYSVASDGAVTVHDAIVPEIAATDYKDFAKAYAEKNLITEFDENSNILNAKPITIRSDGKQVIFTWTGINDVVKKVRGNRKSQAILDSLFVLDDLVGGAHKVESKENLKGRINPYSYYVNRFTDSNGQTYDVTIHIKDTPELGRYHYHNLTEAEIKIEPSHGTSSDNGTIAGVDLFRDDSILPSILAREGDKVKLQTEIEPPNGTSSDNGTIAGGDLIKGDSISPSILAREGDKVKLQTKKEAEQQPPVNGLQLPEMATEVNLNSSIQYGEDSVKSLLDISAAKGKIHTPEQQKVIQEYQNATDEELVKFAKVVKTFPDRRAASKMEYTLPPVAPKLAADIKEATGIDASGFQNSIKGNAVEHILKRHGENGQHDHSMANLADLGRIQYVLEHYDTLERLYGKDGRPNLSREFKNTDGNPAQLILLKKRINGTFYLVEAVPDSAAKKLQVVSAYIQKRKEGDGQVPDAKAPGLTAKTVLTSTPSPFMLPQEALPVNEVPKKRSNSPAPDDAANAVPQMYVQDVKENASNKGAGQAPDVANTTPGMTPKSDLVTTPVSSLAQESDPVNSSSAITPAISSDSTQNRIEYANKPAWQAALQRNEGEERAAPKLADIVERIRETYHIPISTGKVTHRKALGQYRGKGETIRIRTTNDIPTIAHELGHHLDKQKGFSRGPYQELLIDRLPPEFKANYSQDELAGEGFAEFMRQYLADRETAKENYGEFYEAFRASFAPPELQALDSIANDINRYMTAKIREKMQAATASRLDREKSGGLPNMLRKFYRAFTEGNLSVKEFVDAYEAENGKLPGSKDPYKLITNAAYNDMITKTLIETGFYDAKGRKIEGALSLADALQGISEKEWPDFNLYLMLRHAKEWLSPLPDAEGKIGEPKRVFADDTLNDIATVNLQIRELERESPHFREASEKIYTYLRNLMQYWGVESGLISQDKAYRLWQIYPDYVPFFRQIETKGKGKGPKRGYANQSAPIAKAKGSGAAIYNPIENIIYQTDKFVKAAKYNQVMQAVHNMVQQSDDLGWYLEKVPPDMVPHEVQVADVLKTLRNQVGDKDGQLTDLIDEFLDDTITRFTVAAPKNDIVTVMVDGKRHYYKVHDKDLLKVLTQMDGRQLNEIVRAVNVLTRFFTTFVTGRNPFFSFTSNIWRDFPTAYINGSQGNLFAFGKGIANAYKEQITHSEAFKQYEAMGGGGFVSPISQNRNELRRLIREIQKEDKTKAERLANWIFHPIEAIERLSDIAETAPRFNEFTRVLEKTGDLNEAFYAANEVTTNFRRHGNVGKQINAFIPFFNAAVQGIDKYRRVMTGEGGATKAQRAKYASAAFGRMMVSVILPSLLAMAWNKDYDDEDDKQYPKLSSYMKNNYWNFALGDGKFFSIPKPREYAVFANVMERAIEKEWMDNEEAFRGFGEYLKDTFFPPGIPQGLSFNDFLQALSDVVLIGSIVDVGRNEDFAGRPVVSEGMKRLPDEQQYNDKTSLLAKTIGQATGTSPMVLDFMIKQNAGVFGTLNAAFTANPAERDFTFGTKNKFIRDAVYSTDILNHFYDERDKYAVQYNGDKRNGQKAAKAYAYDKMASFLSEASTLSKENPDASREIRKEMRDMTDSFQKRRSLAIDTELQRIYQNTDCDREIFRDYAAKRKISASKKKESYTAVLDFQQLASYQKAIDKAIREAYQEIWKRADYPLWGDGQRAEAFIKAKKKAVNEVKWEFVKKYGEKE